MWARTLIAASCVFLMGGQSGCAGCDNPQAGHPGYCDSTGCYECSGPADCWRVSGPPTACRSAAECAEGEKCTNLGCFVVCADDSTCLNGATCNGEFCVPDGVDVHPTGPGTNPDDSPSTEPVPESCAADEECQRADPVLVCDNGKCVEACASNDDCPPDYVCAPCGKCTPKDTPTCGDLRVYCDATKPGSCGANRACLTGHCHVTCDAAAACPVGQVCLSGVCVDDPSPKNPQCVLNKDCANGAFCINGYCHAACTGESCGSAETCSTGGGNQGVCMPDYRPVA
jgi:hypothetical protein